MSFKREEALGTQREKYRCVGTASPHKEKKAALFKRFLQHRNIDDLIWHDTEVTYVGRTGTILIPGFTAMRGLSTQL